jgi:hypothetical protein
LFCLRFSVFERVSQQGHVVDCCVLSPCAVPTCAPLFVSSRSLAVRSPVLSCPPSRSAGWFESPKRPAQGRAAAIISRPRHNDTLSLFLSPSSPSSRCLVWSDLSAPCFLQFARGLGNVTAERKGRE